MEKWKILDENGNYTGEILDRDNPRVWEKGVYHKGADIWIINSENKILIQKRSKEKKLEPNVWAMTGGSVIFEETSIQAIIREVKEELGIDIFENDLKIFTKFKTGNVWIDAFVLKLDYDIRNMVFQKEEVSEAKWVTFEEIDEIFSKGQFIKNRWEYVRDSLIKCL